MYDKTSDKKNYYVLDQIWNAKETSMYFYMMSNYTVNGNGAKSVAIKRLDYERCV